LNTVEVLEDYVEDAENAELVNPQHPGKNRRGEEIHRAYERLISNEPLVAQKPAAKSTLRLLLRGREREIRINRGT
jgi:hypothetical protein